MKEATNRNQRIWLLFILICSTYVLFTISAKAQSTPADPGLTQLLDSAEILKLKGYFDDAIALCKKTKLDAENDDDWANVARSLNELAEINRYLGAYNECQKILNQSNQIIVDKLDMLHNEMARNLYYQGKLHSYQRDFSIGYPDIVLVNYHKAENILRQLGSFPKELTYVVWDIARFYESLDSLTIAKIYYGELTILVNENFEELDYRRGFYLYYLGEFYNGIADYERALLFTSIANYIFSHPFNYDKNRLLNSEIVLANIYFNTKQYQSAIPHYKFVIDLCKGENNYYYYEKALKSYAYGGQALLGVQKVDSSILFLKQALSINRGQSDSENLDKALTFLSLGQAFVKKNNYSEAELYFEKALRLITETMGEKHYRTHVIYRNIGEYCEERNLLDDALENYQRGLISLFPDFNSEDVYTDPEYIDYEKKEDIFYVLTDKSGALYKRFLKEGDKQDLIAAFELYKTGYELLVELLNSGFMDESMMQVFLGFKSAFNMSIECAFDLYDYTGDSVYYDQAFQFMEKSRYFLLFKALTNTLFKQSAGITNDLFLRERQLTHDINELKHQLISSDDLDHDLSFSIRNSLLAKLLEKDELWSQITMGSSVSTSLFMDSLILSVEDIQRELVQDDEVIIEYQWSENYIFALTIGKKEVDVNKIAITPELIKQINNYAQSISSESIDNTTMEGFQGYNSSAFYLYQKLFKPVLHNNKNPSLEINRINQITIIPDGMLSYLPFESLLTEIPDTTTVSYWNLPYLLNDYTFRYAYSLNILRNNLSVEQKIEKPKLLAFSYSGEFDEDADIAQLRFEEEIRYSAEELNSIKSRIKHGEFYEDTEATEKVFKKYASQFSLIHLALHGQADITDMYNSKLLFKDDGSTEEDGELYAYELYNMDLSNTEMAVLSACETGIGQQMEGEGIFSIARGFAYAGCPSIFMSLWKVSDKTTAKLMDHFYNNLVKGMPKDKAMQKAKITYIDQADDQGAHPANWAAFIALGNINPIHIPKSWFQWYYGIIVLILITIIVYFIYSRKKAPISR